MKKLESRPTQEQKDRLDAWLTEIKRVCAAHRLLVDTEDGETLIIDMDADTVVGFGLTYLTRRRLTRDGEQEVITAYDCTGSILDGVWLVDTPDGPREQYTL